MITLTESGTGVGDNILGFLSYKPLLDHLQLPWQVDWERALKHFPVRPEYRTSGHTSGEHFDTLVDEIVRESFDFRKDRTFRNPVCYRFERLQQGVPAFNHHQAAIQNARFFFRTLLDDQSARSGVEELLQHQAGQTVICVHVRLGDAFLVHGAPWNTIAADHLTEMLAAAHRQLAYANPLYILIGDVDLGTIRYYLDQAVEGAEIRLTSEPRKHCCSRDFSQTDAHTALVEQLTLAGGDVLLLSGKSNFSITASLLAQAERSRHQTLIYRQTYGQFTLTPQTGYTKKDACAIDRLKQINGEASLRSRLF